MNAWTSGLVWSCMQVTLFSAVAAVIYLAVRRRGPAVGAFFAIWSLAIVIAITALAQSPWPTWRRVAEREQVAALPNIAQTPKANIAKEGGSPTDAGLIGDITFDAPLQPAPAISPWMATWQGFVEGLRRPTTTESSWNWPTVVAGLLLVGIGLALARVIIGLMAVNRYRRQARPIADAALGELTRRLREELGCHSQVVLAESTHVSSPATIGFWRPLVLLPENWREWSDQERQVVLAHELAHVARRDYLASVWAQIGVALHFYNPLVRWLGRRLRLEQEMAADAVAARVSGGEQGYLAILAEMALRQDDRRLSWAARPFLPGRGAFLARIESLRDGRRTRRAPMSALARRGLVAALLAIGLVVAGFRGPAPQAVAAAEPTKPASDAKNQDKEEAASPGATLAVNGTLTLVSGSLIDLNFVPDGAVIVAAIRPFELAQEQGVPQIFKLLEEDGALAQYAQKITHADLDQVVVASTDFLEQSHKSSFVLTLKSKAPIDWRKSIFCDPKYSDDFSAGGAPPSTPATAPAAGRDGQPVAKVPAAEVKTQNSRLTYIIVDDRTLVTSSDRETLQRIVARGKERKPAEWEKSWRRVEQGELSVMADVGFLGKLSFLAGWGGGQSELAKAMLVLQPLFKQGTRFVYLSAGLGHTPTTEELSSLLLVDYQDEASAKYGEESLRALNTLAKGWLDEWAGQLDAALPWPAGVVSAPEKMLLAKLVAIARQLTQKAEVSRNEATVSLAASATIPDFAGLLNGFTSAIKDAREVARKATNQNNIKQIALAMLNYQEMKKQFPAAYTAKDGKPLLSWRVAILPLLGETALYNEFHLDEPWDSEHNKELIAKMPGHYRAPTSKVAEQGKTVYLTPRGPDTVFPGDQGLKVRQIPDGTSLTIMLLEVDDAHAVEWTKPDDWKFDPKQPKAGLAGQYSDGCLVGYCDASVMWLPSTIDAETLKGLVTRNGGEQVKRPMD